MIAFREKRPVGNSTKSAGACRLEGAGSFEAAGEIDRKLWGVGVDNVGQAGGLPRNVLS